jgi:hypothetical protein
MSAFMALTFQFETMHAAPEDGVIDRATAGRPFESQAKRGFADG